MAYINGRKVLNVQVNASGFDEGRAKELTISNETYNNKKVNDTNNIVGYKGYHMIQGTEILSADGKTIDIELRDAELKEKAVDYYSVGDLVNIEASTHLYQKQKIVAITPNGLGRGNTVVTLAEVDGGAISFQLEAENELENWLYVVDNYVGEQIPCFTHAVASGEDAVSAGRGAFCSGRKGRVFGDYGAHFGRENVAVYNAFVTGLKNLALAFRCFVFGQENIARGENSFTGGYKSETHKALDFAFGSVAKAKGGNAVAMGLRVFANALRAWALGEDTTVNGELSFVFGKHLYNTENGQVIFGKCNELYDGKSDPNALFIIANGTTDIFDVNKVATRKDIFKVNKDGSITIGKTKITEEQLKQLLALLN